MKRISIIIVFLFLCALTASAIGPRSPGGSGGGTFTGGTLTSDLKLADGAELELATGTSSPLNLSLRFRTDPDTGFHNPTGNMMDFYADGGAVFRMSNVSIISFKDLISWGGNIYANAAGGYRMTSTAVATSAAYGWNDDGDTYYRYSGLGRFAKGKPNIVADGVECIRVASSGTQIFQYTKLGDEAPALKCKLITGTTPSVVASQTYVAHGLTGAKVVSASCLVFYSASASVPPSYLYTPGYAYDFVVETSSCSVDLRTDAGNITSKDFKILLWYTE